MARPLSGGLRKKYFFKTKKKSDGHFIERGGGVKTLMAWPLAEELFCGFPNVSLPSAYILYCQYIISNQLFSIFFALFQARCGCEDGLWRPASSFLCSLKTRKINSIRWKIREKFGWWQICRDTNGENSASLVNDIAWGWRRYGRHATHSIRQSAWPLPSSRQGYHGKPQTISWYKQEDNCGFPPSFDFKQEDNYGFTSSFGFKQEDNYGLPSLFDFKQEDNYGFPPLFDFKQEDSYGFPPLFDFKQEDNYGFLPSFDF